MPVLVQPADYSVKNEAIVGPELMMSAFQKALVNRQRQADLERKLEQMTIQDNLRERNMQLQDKWHQVSADNATQRIGIEQARANLAEQKSGILSDRTLEFQKALSGIDAKPGTQAWQDKADLVKSDYPDVLPTTSGQRVWKDYFAEHKFTATTSRQATNDIFKRYDDNLKQNGIDDYAFANPSVWKDDPKNKRKALLMDANTNIILPPETDTKDNIDKATGKPKFRWKTLPYSDWNTFKAQHDKVKQVLGSNDSRPAEQTSVKQAPPNPQDREPETIYMTPKGALKWTSDNVWVNP